MRPFLPQLAIGKRAHAMRPYRQKPGILKEDKRRTGKVVATNTVYYELQCPVCGSLVKSGIGFRVGQIKQHSYHLGQKVVWDGPVCRPWPRPPGGNLKTIGYFNCDNPRCDTWQDCFPEVQEALITIVNDEIRDVQVTKYKPGELTFDIIEPEGLV